MNKLLKNIVLLFVAIFLLFTIGIYGLVYSFFKSILTFSKANFIGYWADLLYQINVGIDMIGNVMLGKFLNHHAIINPGYDFGKVKHTISHVLAVNQKNNNLTEFGKWIVNILEWIDPGHMEKSL